MDVIHLIWICPCCAAIGVFITALLSNGANNDLYSIIDIINFIIYYDYPQEKDYAGLDAVQRGKLDGKKEILDKIIHALKKYVGE